jgi:paired amphipathic helix protein Sin3a
MTARPPPDVATTAATLVHQQEQRGVSQLQSAVSAATGRSVLSPSGDNVVPIPGQALNGVGQAAQSVMGAEKRGPVEFNHAISYVNKIKVRAAKRSGVNE